MQIMIKVQLIIKKENENIKKKKANIYIVNQLRKF